MNEKEYLHSEAYEEYLHSEAYVQDTIIGVLLTMAEYPFQMITLEKIRRVKAFRRYSKGQIFRAIFHLVDCGTFELNRRNPASETLRNGYILRRLRQTKWD